MRIVIAPDGFKGCLSAAEVCEAIRTGVARACPEADIEAVPMADGGGGTVDALVAATGGTLLTTSVTGPLGESVETIWGILGDGVTGVIEMAAASGLTLVPEDWRDPLETTTFGTGELIRAALDSGCSRLIIGIGGSATTDAGGGMAQALGARLLDAAGRDLRPFRGRDMAALARIDVGGLDPRLRATEMRVACDVINPLYGEQGAAFVYGPQKGASPESVTALDAGLRNVAARLVEDLDRDVAQVPGAGAAGGLGAGLMAFCGARLDSGVDIVIDAVGLRERVRGADLVITGEGRIDLQTAFGKTAAGVARVARELGVPVVALGGEVTEELSEALDAAFVARLSIQPGPGTLAEAMDPDAARRRLGVAAQQVVRLFAAGRQVN